MDFLQNLHSGLRWILLLILVLAVYNAFMKWRSKAAYGTKDRLINLLSLIFLHTQVLIGLILYFGNEWYKGFKLMDIPIIRFFAIEHLFGMLLAAVLLTIGRKRAEKTDRPAGKHRKILIWYGITLIIILASIPWPFISKFSGYDWF